jgi:hypothetical protein
MKSFKSEIFLYDMPLIINVLTIDNNFKANIERYFLEKVMTLFGCFTMK